LDSDRRRGLIERAHPTMTVRLQCETLGVPRATFYHQPRPLSTQNGALMRAIDELHLALGLASKKWTPIQAALMSFSFCWFSNATGER
jgi:hypothetical protein